VICVLLAIGTTPLIGLAEEDPGLVLVPVLPGSSPILIVLDDLDLPEAGDPVSDRTVRDIGYVDAGLGFDPWNGDRLPTPAFSKAIIFGG